MSNLASAHRVIQLDEASHEYTVNGKPFPGVTRVLDDALQEYRDIDPAVLKAAQERGTAVHLACDLYDRSTLDFTSLDPVVVPRLEAYMQFLTDTGFQPELIEEKVAHLIYGYAGKLDRLGCTPRGKSRWVVDIKTPLRLGKSVGPQTAAYEQALRNMLVIDPKERIERYALQLFDDGTYKLVPLKGAGDFNVFVAALTLYQFKNRR